ncbi:MAG: (2Fe-2S) ferredoxin domain-containing protein [Anaerolineales bacterium]|nr:(2Fe-2S) ferredoxin domain-containing protein [Anaerolineales bacterium]
MPIVKSLEELRRVRDEARQKRAAKTAEGQIQIIVGMGTPGIAAGARETVKAILDYIEQAGLTGIVVRQTGNIGLDSWEPIVQVQVGAAALVAYGKVTAAVAREIMRRHIQGGQVAAEYVIPR